MLRLQAPGRHPDVRGLVRVLPYVVGSVGSVGCNFGTERPSQCEKTKTGHVKRNVARGVSAQILFSEELCLVKEFQSGFLVSVSHAIRKPGTTDFVEPNRNGDSKHPSHMTRCCTLTNLELRWFRLSRVWAAQ